jgi:hypothetical protein
MSDEATASRTRPAKASVELVLTVGYLNCRLSRHDVAGVASFGTHWA